MGMASQGILLNLVEGLVLSRIVLSQARNVFEEIRRDGLILDPPFWLRERGVDVSATLSSG